MALASPLCSFPLVLKGLVDQADDLVTAYLPTCLLLPVGSTCAASISPPSPRPHTCRVSLPSHNWIFSGHTAWGAGSQFPDQRWNPCPLQWKHRVQSAGNSLTVFLIICFGFVASVMSLFQTISDCCFFCLWDLTSPTRDGTRAPCIGSVESQPLVLQRSPLVVVFWIFYFFLS